MTDDDICPEVDVYLGVERKCGRPKGHDGIHRAVCSECKFVVPRGSDGWHRCVEKGTQ